jgi:hypothetical protein
VEPFEPSDPFAPLVPLAPRSVFNTPGSICFVEVISW